ncbi:hypothetical protein SAMN02799624_01845 [Paenibacillus sp. UNC496MF]|nr:hypothetical protein SAMN02799624_01845 [Paenibacillus sp. UNC496MF]
MSLKCSQTQYKQLHVFSYNLKNRLESLYEVTVNGLSTKSKNARERSIRGGVSCFAWNLERDAEQLGVFF